MSTPPMNSVCTLVELPYLTFQLLFLNLRIDLFHDGAHICIHQLRTCSPNYPLHIHDELVVQGLLLLQAGRQAGRQATSISYNMNKTSKMVANKFKNQNPAQTMRRCSSMQPRGSGFCFLKFTTLVTSYNHVHHYYCIHQFVKLAQYRVYTELGWGAGL